MPIKVTCQCGKSFAAKDELAGKAVKCPNCQQPLRIPGAPAAGLGAPLPSAKPSQPPASAPAGSSSGRPAAGGVGGLFDEIGLKQAPAGAVLCPGCTQPMPPNAVICIKCGYNTKLGRRMETVIVGKDPAGGGVHAVATEDFFQKAAQSIEEDKEAEKAKTREGMPWWVYLIGLFMVTGFIVMMMVLPRQMALMTGGLILYSAAGIISLYAWIRIMMIAFSENVGFFLMVLLCGCLGTLIYSIMRWDRCAPYFLMMVAANVVSNLVGYAIQAGFMSGEDEGRVPTPPPPAAVARANADCLPPPLLKAAGA